MRRFVPLLFIILTGCATAPNQSASALTGTVTTETPLTLPKGARLGLLLVDARAAGANPGPVAESWVAAPAQFPIPFELPYPVDRISPDGDYRLIVQIEYANAVWYSNVLRSKRVLVAGAPTGGIEVPVRKDGVLR